MSPSLNDAVWRHAPYPALRVTRGDALHWQANEAARRHPVCSGFDDAAWQAIAERVIEVGAGRREAAGAVALDVVACTEGWLAWLMPVDPFVATGLSAGEPMELAQVHGRIGVFVRDLVHGVGYWDKHTFAIWGLDPQQGAPHFDAAQVLIHPDDRAPFMSGHRRALEQGGRHNTRYRIVRSGGEVRHLNTLFEIRYDADGRPKWLIGAVIDDTDVVLHTQASQRSLERLSRSGELAGVSMWQIDWPAQTIRFNAVGWRFLGLPPSQDKISLASVRATAHPDDVPAIEQAAQRALDGDEIVDLRARYRNAAGAWRTLLTRRVAERNEQGEAIGFAGVSVDISDQVEAEQALQLERARAAMALDAADVGTWERDLDGTPRYWSAGMYRLRGFSPDDPRPIDLLAKLSTAAATRDESLALARRHVETGSPYEHEYAVSWPDGQTRWLVTRGNVVRDTQGLPLYMAGINVDVTERHQAHLLRLEMQRAEEASRAKTEFMARMSHELRTPLNAVLGFSRLLQSDPQQPLSGQQLDRVQRILGAGKHLLALIDNVLDLARLESKGEAEAAEAVSLPVLLQEAAERAAEAAAANGVSLRLDAQAVPGEPAAVVAFAPRAALVQIVDQLLNNAIKFNHRGGWVSLICQCQDGGCALLVRDSGRGLDRAQIDNIFRPFERLGADREGIAGTGMGLTLVKHRVEALGGRIEVRSTPTAGSEFALWLPAAGEALPAVAPSAVLHALCIEDNPVNLLLVREMFALRPGMTLDTAEDGLSGLDRAMSQPPDLLLLDMQLPDIDGMEVMRRVRAEPRLAACHIVALSANAMPGDVKAALEAGFDDYWTKPIDFARFLASLDDLAARCAKARA